MINTEDKSLVGPLYTDLEGILGLVSNGDDILTIEERLDKLKESTGAIVDKLHDEESIKEIVEMIVILDHLIEMEKVNE